ncbi:hypothetical protein [Enterobacter sp. Bisph1]|uniref:hypothetical protein n=1 Tax=Enterobacter sp. Bisph1 TaxID=1274399 RepID=UPI0012DFF953|nr:hypothetical protein [Enterobacter sp. Bisph1]
MPGTKTGLFTKPDRWGVHTGRGKAGAVLPKVTSDLLLWSSGISTALLTTSLLAIAILFYREPQITFKSVAQISYVLMVLIAFVFVNVWCYFILKRDKAALFSVVNSPRLFTLSYCFIILLCFYAAHKISVDMDKKASVAHSQPTSP